MLQNRAFLSEPVVKDLPAHHWAASHLSVNQELPRYLLIITGVGISHFVGVPESPSPGQPDPRGQSQPGASRWEPGQCALK